jgi:hypothetical protein
LDNARPPNSAGQLNLSAGKTSSEYHTPYSPDVTPSDFYPFGMLKEKFKNCSARPFDELKQEVDSILTPIFEAELISVFQT